jgi:hypothetical protein
VVGEVLQLRRGARRVVQNWEGGGPNAPVSSWTKGAEGLSLSRCLKTSAQVAGRVTTERARNSCDFNTRVRFLSLSVPK